MHPLPDRHRMPYRSLGDKFVGRVDAIWNLYDSLFRDHTTVLHGMGVVAGTGGLGKTQLAIEYAHRFGSAYPGGVYWVDADLGFSAMITEISGAAGIEIDTRVEEQRQAEQLWRGLNSLRLPVLIVLDNFPENVALSPYLPAGGRVHTIVTTRRQDLGHATVRLKALSNEEGVRLLNSGERQFGVNAAFLVERLGGLPLALELSKSYLNFRSDLTIPVLLDEMKVVGEIEALGEFASEYRDQLPGRHALDVAATFQLSWNLAPDGTKQVLRVMGELAPAPVPRRLLRLILDLPEQAALRDELNKSMAELARLSLVELDTAGDPVAHRLILAFVRHRKAVDDASPFDECLKAMQGQMKRAFDDPDASTNRELEELVSHAEFLTGSDRLTHFESGFLLNSLGRHHKTMARFTAAREAFSASLAAYEKKFEPGDRNITAVQGNLAVVLKDLGQLEEARDLLRAALASEEKTFEPGHSSIAISQSNLAVVLQDLGQLEEARDLLRAALASAEKTFEPGHPSIAAVQSNLAQMLQDLGQLEEAHDLLRTALATNEKTFEPGHPSIAAVQSNLALVLKDLGQLEEAHDLLRAALASNEKTFEPDHPSIARSQSNLATVLQDLGQLEEARDLLHAALASAEKTFEPGHPSIGIRQSKLAAALKDLGQLEEARDLLRKAYSASLKRYGAENPNTKLYKNNLASLRESES